jgi:hypothetical protein
VDLGPDAVARAAGVDALLSPVPPIVSPVRRRMSHGVGFFAPSVVLLIAIATDVGVQFVPCRR